MSENKDDSSAVLQEKSNDNLEEEILEIVWIAPFGRCDWLENDFILKGLSN